uniref:Uncharacterized protein n=1 Tax=Ovis aries TaxID=9940 RepID=A0AC11DTK8_SHEEP
MRPDAGGRRSCQKPAVWAQSDSTSAFYQRESFWTPQAGEAPLQRFPDRFGPFWTEMLRAGDRLSWSTQPILTLEGDARVVDQHVEASVLLAQEVAHGADALPVIDVQLVETGAQALRLQLLHSRPTPRLVPRREHHVPLELPAQVTHDGEADALVGPGDQRHAVGGRHGRCAGFWVAFNRELRVSASAREARGAISALNYPGRLG